MDCSLSYWSLTMETNIHYDALSKELVFLIYENATILALRSNIDIGICVGKNNTKTGLNRKVEGLPEKYRKAFSGFTNLSSRSRREFKEYCMETLSCIVLNYSYIFKSETYNKGKVYYFPMTTDTIDIDSCKDSNTDWVVKYHSLAPLATSGSVQEWCTKPKKLKKDTNPMYYDNGGSTETERTRRYFINRVEFTSPGSLLDELFHIFENPPKDAEDMVAKIKAGEFYIDEERKQIWTYDIPVWGRHIVWRKPGEEADHKGHDAAWGVFNKLMVEVTDKLMVTSDPLAMLKLFTDFEAKANDPKTYGK